MAVQVLRFGDKVRKIFVVVVVSWMIFGSVGLGHFSGPCYLHESSAFFHGAVHAGDDVMVGNDFIE